MNESRQKEPATHPENEIDLRDLFRTLWGGKWLIGSITVATTVIAVIVTLMLPNIYRAEALLAPGHNEGANGLSALSAQYGGLASLAGINIGTGNSNKTELALEILKSRKFVAEFIEKRDILVPLMATKAWSREKNELEIDPEMYDVDEGRWIRKVRAPRAAVPSAQESYRKFKSEALSASQNKKTGFITVSIEHYSPTIAKQWVDWLVQDINATVMRQDVTEAQQAIEYLKGQIQATSLADLQSVFFRLIEEQTKTIMLAKVSPEYILRTIDPAVVPELKSRPNRRILVVLGALFGLGAGAIIVFVISGVAPRR